MGTNNPSEEQIEHVQAKIIELATSITDDAAMLEANSYFDECGFDVESRGNALQAKLIEYIEKAEDVDPTVEDHPQPRRMARYLLENVDYEILEKPLSSALVKSKPTVTVKSAGEGAMLFGYPRNLVLALALVLLLMIGAIAFVVSSMGAEPEHNHGGGGGLGGEGFGGGGGGRKFRKGKRGGNESI